MRLLDFTWTEAEMIDKGHYLLFDGGCATCAALASAVAAASEGRLKVASLREEEFQGILNRVRPGWRFEPTLLSVDGDRVPVLVGFRMRARIVRILGPQRAARVAMIARRFGVPLLGRVGRPTTDPRNPSRRWMLRWMAGMAGVALIALFVKEEPTPAEALDCTERDKCRAKCDADHQKALDQLWQRYQDCQNGCDQYSGTPEYANCIQRCRSAYSNGQRYADFNRAACYANCPPCVDDTPTPTPQALPTSRPPLPTSRPNPQPTFQPAPQPIPAAKKQ